MKVRYTVHRNASMHGKVEDVDDALADRLIAAGHAVAVTDEPAAAQPVERNGLGVPVAEVPAPAAEVPAPAAEQPDPKSRRRGES